MDRVTLSIYRDAAGSGLNWTYRDNIRTDFEEGQAKKLPRKDSIKKKVDHHCGGITRWSPLSPGSEPSKVASKEKQFLSLHYCEQCSGVSR